MFPKPIIKTKFPREFTPEELNVVYTEKIGNSVGNKSSSNRRILDNPAMWELKKFAEECLDEWVKSIICPRDADSVKLEITQSWLNYTDPTGFHHAHYHPNSIVSGVIYILADRAKDQIEFHDDAPRQWHIDNATANEFNSNQYHVPVHTGDVVLFPSVQYHGVPEVQGQTKRISLAFNSFWKGRLGFNDDATNYLEIHSIK
jgi:uncharacterized protein (TIGR02466 family)